jgi:ADP-heptose:LPS heptosyltransferase
VHAEQGFGDTLQFSRYVPLLAARGARILLRVQPALVSLLRSVMQPLLGEAVVVCADADNHALPPFDCHCPLMSLALVFSTRIDSVPPPLPWPPAAADLQRSWAARLAAWPAKDQSQSQDQQPYCRIGIAWSGSASHANDTCRSMPLARYQELLALLPAGVQLVSLQKDLGAADRLVLERDGRIAHFAAEQRDFADTAALIGQLDAVISVDTSVAHLAAAMGKPTWILLAHAPDWRWMLGRGDSPWYGCVSLVRQPRSGDWDSVVRQAAQALAAWLAAW